MKQPDDKPNEEAGDQVPVSRRKLIQALATAGGTAAAATLLPEKWTRPVVESAELPEQVGGSPCPITSMLFESPVNGSTRPVGSTPEYMVITSPGVAGVVVTMSTTTPTTIQVVTTSATTDSGGTATGTFQALSVGPANLTASACGGRVTTSISFSVVAAPSVK